MIFWNYLKASKQSTALPSRMLQHAGDTAACGTFMPATEGPVAIVIGAKAPRAALRTLAKKHGLELADLECFARQGVQHA